MKLFSNKKDPTPVKKQSVPVISAPAAAKTPAEGLLNLINELVRVMMEEGDLIEARKHREHADLVKIKQRLTMDYRAAMKALEAQPDMLKSLPDAKRLELKQAAQRLSDVAERNAKYLRVVIIATQRLLQNIISLVRQEVMPKTSYRNPQTAHLQLGVYSPVCPPIALNRTV